MKKVLCAGLLLVLSGCITRPDDPMPEGERAWTVVSRTAIRNDYLVETWRHRATGTCLVVVDKCPSCTSVQPKVLIVAREVCQ